MQKLMLIGHLGQDAKVMKGKNEFVSFSLAVNTPARVDRETGEVLKPEETTWFSCTYYNTKLAPYLKKGTQVFVSGDYGFQVYKDSEGKGRPDFRCYVDEIQLLTSKGAEKQKEKEPIDLEA